MLSKKMNSITPSFTINISTKVNEMKKNGIDVINLSIGEPDFFTPYTVKIGANKAIENNLTKYDSAQGLVVLREAISKKLENENDVIYDKSEIVVSSGAKHAITNTLIALLDSGDEVLVIKPYWVSYPEMIKICGGIPVFVETSKERDFKCTVEELKSAVTEKTKMIFLNNPSNPTGAIYTKEELLPIVEFCIENNIYILADEIYERVCHIDKFTSIPSLSEKAKDITVLINGFSKSASMTGWRLGYSASNKEIASAISTVQGHLVSHPSTITQWGGLEALTGDQTEINHMLETYSERRRILVDRLNNIEDITYVNPDGAFYLFIDMSAIKSKLEHNDSFSLVLCDDLLTNYNLALVPGIAFGNDDYIRISYATDLNLVVKGLDIIDDYIKAKMSK